MGTALKKILHVQLVMKRRNAYVGIPDKYRIRHLRSSILIRSTLEFPGKVKIGRPFVSLPPIKLYTLTNETQILVFKDNIHSILPVKMAIRSFNKGTI